MCLMNMNFNPNLNSYYPYKTDITKMELVNILFPEEGMKHLQKRLEKASKRYLMHPLISVAPRRDGCFKQEVIRINLSKIPNSLKIEDYGVTWIDFNALEPLLDLYV
jgi:hypothetical protein